MNNEPKSNQQIVDEANELARDFYKSMGYEVPKCFPGQSQMTDQPFRHVCSAGQRHY